VFLVYEPVIAIYSL